MSVFRPLLAAIGLVGFLVGIWVTISPEAATLIPLGRSFAELTGMVALFLGAFIVTRRRRVSRDRTEFPDAERRAPLPVPGDTVETLLDEASTVRLYSRPNSRGHRSQNAGLRRRLTPAAVEILMTEYGDSPAEARRRLNAGDWTDDPHAAAFFMNGFPDWTPRVVRARARLSTEDPVGQWARHAVDELWQLSETTR